MIYPEQSTQLVSIDSLDLSHELQLQVESTVPFGFLRRSASAFEAQPKPFVVASIAIAFAVESVADTLGACTLGFDTPAATSKIVANSSMSCIAAKDWNFVDYNLPRRHLHPRNLLHRRLLHVCLGQRPRSSKLGIQ